MPSYTIGLDYGSNSVRCVIVDVKNGDELSSSVYEYETGDAGIILDSFDHNPARQNPADYIIGVGIDTTGSTPLPVDKEGTPLGLLTQRNERPFRNKRKG